MSHPYYPRDLDIPNYVPKAWTMGGLFGVFGSAVGVVAVLTWTLSGRLTQQCTAVQGRPADLSVTGPVLRCQETLPARWHCTG